jgi:hypothetical protein
MQLIFSWLLAGLKQYDPDGVDAEAIEAAIEGVQVIRHGKCNIHTVIIGCFDCLSNSIAGTGHLMLNTKIFFRIVV